MQDRKEATWLRQKPMRLNPVTLRLVFILKRWRVCISSKGLENVLWLFIAV